MPSTFVGNCNHIVDWNKVIESIDTQQGVKMGPYDKTGQLLTESDLMSIPSKNTSNQVKTLIDAGYGDHLDSIEWYNYIAGEHYSKDVDQKIADFLGVKPWHSWISCVRPGKLIAWHWDFDYYEYSTEGGQEELDGVRYSCFISPPAFGQIFVIEDTPFYNQEQGNIYKWSDGKAYHGSANFGLKSKYLYNFRGHP